MYIKIPFSNSLAFKLINSSVLSFRLSILIVWSFLFSSVTWANRKAYQALNGPRVQSNFSFIPISMFVHFLLHPFSGETLLPLELINFVIITIIFSYLPSFDHQTFFSWLISCFSFTVQKAEVWLIPRKYSGPQNSLLYPLVAVNCSLW